MSVMKRMSMIFKSKANKALDRMEDPRETLDYSYQRQLEMLQQVRRGVADVATSRKRLELQINQKEREQQKLTDQAKTALQKGREDLAREALSRRNAVESQLGELRQQFASLQGDEEKLTLASQRLQAKVDSFRTRKETLKATYTAAEAQTKINEAFSGISEEMGDVGLAIQRAEEKTQNMQARAGAIDELLASGALEDYSGPRDDIQAELDRMGASGPGVDLELERLKAEVGEGEAPKQLDAGRGGEAKPAQQEARPAQQEDAARPQQAQNPPQPGGAQ
ncbi:MAG TPA: PspA/IM30 family protein [Streptosporangiaceae bacterium]|nr:PspA/IM30 family protein [Streptosporangiaceae bacterium]